MDTELGFYFPQHFGDDFNQLQRIRQYLIAQCEDNTEVMKALEVEMLGTPKCFDPYDPGNVIMEAEESFEDVCAVMQESGVSDPKKLTVFEFYSKLRFYEKKYKKNGHS